MNFSEFSKYLERLEGTPSRLEITRILSQLLKKLDSSEVAGGVFLSLGTIGPQYEKTEFGISEKLMEKIIARAFSVSPDSVIKAFKTAGDLGTVAQELRSRKPELRIKETTVGEIFERLKEVAGVGGAGSVERKIELAAKLLKDISSLSNRYVVRIPLGAMRLGFSEKTILEALTLIVGGGAAVSFARGSQSRSVKEKLEGKYRCYPNIGEIAEAVRLKGLKGLNEIRLRVGVPVESQLCARLETAGQMLEKVGGKSGRVAAEYKYDGVRLQIHLDRSAQNQKSKLPASSAGRRRGDKNQNLSFEGFGEPDRKVRMFTRNFEQMQTMFPDLTAAVLKSVAAREAVVDGEVVGIDPTSGKFIPFQETIQRKRKYNVAEMAKKIPVKFFAFDILFKDGRDLTSLAYLKRREILLKTVKKGEMVKVTDNFVADSAGKLTDYFKEAKSQGLEGLIVKNLESPYEAGNRGFSWVKFKREETGDDLEDTIDCVVLGYYKGTGKRAGFGIGAFLVGIFDEKNEKFLTIAKIGTGLTDEEWRELKVKSQKSKVKSVPGNVEMRKELLPDVICEPKIVVVIRSDEVSLSPLHTSGYALRFPRMMGYRQDKKADQSTSLEEIKKFYGLQKRK